MINHKNLPISPISLYKSEYHEFSKSNIYESGLVYMEMRNHDIKKHELKLEGNDLYCFKPNLKD